MAAAAGVLAAAPCTPEGRVRSVEGPSRLHAPHRSADGFWTTRIEYAPPPPGAVKLPQPDLHGHHHPAFEHVVSSRRSCRDFASPPSGALHLYELAQMCWAAQGITAPEEPPDEFGHAGAAQHICASS